MALPTFFDGEEDEDVPFLGVDKPATPAERTRSAMDLEQELQRARPLVLTAQRDSDVNKDIENSRVNAFAEFSQLQIRTGSTLLDQFHTNYIPRVFALTLPWCVGGPDFPNQPRHRRCFDDAPALSLDAFTAMIAARCESAIRTDWDLNPGCAKMRPGCKLHFGSRNMHLDIST